MSQSMKNYIYTSKLKLWVECFVNFFVINGIDIHQLKSKPFRILEFLAKNLFKKCGFLYLFSNKCIIIIF
jgi:hypothetical protein